MLVFGEGRRTPAKPRLHMTDADADQEREEPRMIRIRGPAGETVIGPDPEAFARWEAENDD